MILSELMKKQYLIRLDDACPTMDSMKWQQIETLLDIYKIKPMVGVVPRCKDPDLYHQKADPDFWRKVYLWQEKGWTIALHGYDHCYISKKGTDGLNPLWDRSEFSGVSLEIQKKKIREGIEEFKKHGITPNSFFAPSHTFDKNTLIALKDESDIRIISDTYALKPYNYDGFSFVPCQLGHPQKMSIPGVFTICIHPNAMKESQMEEFEHFLKKNDSQIIGFNNIDYLNLKRMRFIDRIVQWLYFKYKILRS